MPTCHVKPQDKQAFISAVGKELVRTHGKQKHYKPSAVHRAASDAGYPIDIHCWAYCFFCSHDDFDALHAASGEACDYAAMRGEVLGDLAGGSWFSLDNLDFSWLDWPDFDLSSCFDWIDCS